MYLYEGRIALTTNDKYKINNSKIKRYLCNVTSESVMLGIFLAMAGGFLDTYTFVGRGGVFANTQTGNLVLLGVDVIKGDWNKTLTHILPIIAFIIGVLCAETIKKSSSILSIAKAEHAVLIFEIAILFFIGLLPHTVSNNVVNIIISFVTSLQYCAFKKLADSPYATTMCTGNLRSASQAAYAALTKGDNEAAKKSLRYFIIIFSFLLGAIVGGYLTSAIGNQAVWGADIFLIISLALLIVNECTADIN